MDTLKVYFDEAGNTGQDLLNDDQPVFVLASHSYSDEQIFELISLFPQADELHFKKLKESPQGRAAIIKFINHPLIDEHFIQISTANKKYVVAGQIGYYGSNGASQFGLIVPVITV